MARRRTRYGLVVLLVSLVVLSASTGAWAQGGSPAGRVPEGPKWEVEVHAGGAFGNQPTGGTAISTFPVGESFTTIAGRPSRYASTWYFGDGAALINQIAAGFAGIPVVTRMTPLDPVLTSSSVERQRDGTLGFRVSRRIAPRLRAEFGFDSIAGSLSLTDGAVKGIEATRAGFAPVWDAIIATGGGVIFMNGVTSSQAALTNDTKSRQTLLTGAVNFDLIARTRLVPYVTAGAGVLKRSGATPAVTLTGHYQFNCCPTTGQFSETDVVTIHFAAEDNVLVSLFGGGVKYALSPRQGLRADLRVYVSTHSMETLVDARPGRLTGSPSFTIASGTTPSVMFTNSAAARSNLTGPAITDLKTFTGSGRDVQASLVAGYFFRFSAMPAAPQVGAPQLGRPRALLSGKKWEVEVHGGGTFGTQPAEGTPISSFPAGESFTTSFGRPSRYASTWYFGDGGALINQIAAGFAGAPAASTKVTPLDPVLTTAALERERRGSFGVRLSRRLTSRLSAEFGLDSAKESLKLTDTALQGIEATRASFTPMWNALLATGSTLFLTPSVSSTSALTSATDNRQTSVTGAVVFELATGGRAVPFVTGGAGLLRRSGELPSAVLTGNYQFRFLGAAPFNQSDVVTLHFTAKDNSFIGLFGGGVKYLFSARHGLRAELRVHVTSNAVDTLVDARPAWVQGSPTFSISSVTTPSLVFSNTSSLRPNLTGPDIVDLKTFTSAGRNIRADLMAGYFFRF